MNKGTTNRKHTRQIKRCGLALLSYIRKKKRIIRQKYLTMWFPSDLASGLPCATAAAHTNECNSDKSHGPLHCSVPHHCPDTVLLWHTAAITLVTLWLKLGFCRLNQASATDSAIHPIWPGPSPACGFLFIFYFLYNYPVKTSLLVCYFAK